MAAGAGPSCTRYGGFRRIWPLIPPEHPTLERRSREYPISHRTTAPSFAKLRPLALLTAERGVRRTSLFCLAAHWIPIREQTSIFNFHFRAGISPLPRLKSFHPSTPRTVLPFDSSSFLWPLGIPRPERQVVWRVYPDSSTSLSRYSG